MKRRVSFKVIGRVQGVAYRASARDMALRLGVNGWIRNLPDGNVDGEAEGEASAVDAFLAWASKGPPGARVDRLDVDDATLVSVLRSFQIRSF
jgi:acylphosphatase